MFAGSDRRGSVLHSLIVWGLYWRFSVIVSLYQGLIVRAPYFLSLDEKVQQCLRKGGSTRLMTAPRRRPSSSEPVTPPPSSHLVTFWRKKKGSSTKISTCRKPLKSYQIILSKLNAITCLTITSKLSVVMMEMFSSLDKYPTLCKPKLLGPS